MEKICEVSNPEFVLKQLKKYYGNEVDLYLSSSKNKKYMVKRYTLEVSITRILRNIKTKKEEITLEQEIRNGRMPRSIHQHIYRIICCGD